MGEAGAKEESRRQGKAEIIGGGGEGGENEWRGQGTGTVERGGFGGVSWQARALQLGEKGMCMLRR